jgi:N-acetylated-alpha-linked acidic dipeptidase
LGSGSDYTVFLDHLGIPSLSMGFAGPYGVYHSLYDSHRWMDRFGDSGWQYHPTIAEIWGRTALRLANADILPLDYGEYGQAIVGYLQDLEKKSAAIAGLQLDWGELQREARDLQRIGEEIRSGMTVVLSGPENGSKNARINELLRQAERGFLLDAGLPRRPWFRHSIYAPGFYTGYASLPLPGLAAALDEKDAAGVRDQAGQLLERIKRVNRTLDQVRRLTQ